MKQFFKTLKPGLLLTGLVSIALGIILIAVPGVIENALRYILGGGLAVFGIFEVVSVFVRPNGLLSVGRMIPGILSLTVGLVFFFQRETFLALIWMLMGVALLIDSVYKLQYAFELKSAKVTSWWVNLLASLTALILAVVLIIRPLENEAAMSALSGWLILSNGVLDLIVVGVMAYYYDYKGTGAVYEIQDASEQLPAVVNKGEKGLTRK